MSYSALSSLSQPLQMPFDPTKIGADIPMPVINADGTVSYSGTYGNPGPVPSLQAISGYQPWGSNLPAGAGFGTKLGSWLSGNGQMIGNMANLFASGVQAYTGLKQLSLAKDALNFEKKSFKTNLANQVDSYNTQMRDRITGRYYATEEERQAALKAAELPQGMRG